MKPFNSVMDAMDWIANHAIGPVEVFVFSPRYILGGRPIELGETVEARKCYRHFIFE